MAGKKEKIIEETLEMTETVTPEPEEQVLDMSVFAGMKELSPMVKARLEYHCEVNKISDPQTMAAWEQILTQL